MKARPLLFLLICCLVASPALLRAEEPQPVPAEEIHAAIEKGLGFLEEAGKDWVEQRDCVSCHQIPSLVWSYNEAARRGIRVNEARRHHWQQWGTDWNNFMSPENREKNTRESTLDANTETLSFLILGHYSEDGQEPPWVQEFRVHLRKTQQQDGSWKPQGQVPLQKRSAWQNSAVTSLWAVLALGGSIDDPAVSKFGDYLNQTAPALFKDGEPVSTEYCVALMLVGDERTRSGIQLGLPDKQRPDGGWGWLLDDDSDAFGTGLALYGLLKTEFKADDPAITRGVRYLLATQQADGSWKVPSTRKKDNNQVNETATSWGTAWAVIGLCQMLPEEVKRDQPEQPGP